MIALNISNMPGTIAVGEPLIVGRLISSRRFCPRRKYGGQLRDKKPKEQKVRSRAFPVPRQA
jgi:hypothetical protein